ncbi:MAG: hypothetical protein ACFE9R_04785, partial [Candidatus Hermodarchaeota archaeon]
KEVSDVMLNLKRRVTEKIEEDMALRSNFEFSSENRNLLEDPSLKKKIQQGISILRRSGLITVDMENEIRTKLDSILNR